MSRQTRYARYDAGRLPVPVPVRTWSHLTYDGLGADAAPAPAAAALPGGFDLQKYLPSAAQAYATYEAAADPRAQVELLKAKIANMRTMKAKVPFAAVFYDNEIAKLQAKLRAAQSQVGVAKEKEQATRDWRQLGFTVSGVGILIGAALLGVLVIGGARLARSR